MVGQRERVPYGRAADALSIIDDMQVVYLHLRYAYRAASHDPSDFIPLTVVTMRVRNKAMNTRTGKRPRSQHVS